MLKLFREEYNIYHLITAAYFRFKGHGCRTAGSRHTPRHPHAQYQPGLRYLSSISFIFVHCVLCCNRLIPPSHDHMLQTKRFKLNWSSQSGGVMPPYVSSCRNDPLSIVPLRPAASAASSASMGSAQQADFSLWVGDLTTDVRQDDFEVVQIMPMSSLWLIV